ncbi:MAG: hypothetical protein NT039_03200 [Candidatus Berkelbacteria bacterium]|nr:hypothetical protein [Candidatus Berkelbacteria bacterium]
MLEKIKNASAKKRRIMIIGLVGGVILIIILLRILGSEDTWICQDGKWIKHGQPKGPMPTEICPRDIK